MAFEDNNQKWIFFFFFLFMGKKRACINMKYTIKAQYKQRGKDPKKTFSLPEIQTIYKI